MMQGMLVPVEALEVEPEFAYEPVDKAADALATLFDVDPDFVSFCKALYGDDIDPVDVWLDVYKMNPAGPDLQTHAEPRKRRKGVLVSKELTDRQKRGLVAGASAVGAAAGLVGTFAGAKAVRGHMGKPLRPSGRPLKGAARRRDLGRRLKRGFKNTTKTERALLAVEPVGLTGEIGATHILGHDARGGDRDKVRKGIAVPGVHQMAAGYETGMRRNLAPAPNKAQTALKPRKAKPVPAAGGAVVKSDDVDVVWAGEFSKFDDEKRLVFGWASVVELNGVPVVDRQGDYIHPDDLENASYDYVLKSRVGGDMHQRDHGDRPLKISDMVESVVFTPEKIAKMGLPPEAAEKIPTGWWVGFKVHNERAWDEVKKGHKAGFSIHGRGKRVPTAMDALVPGYA